MKKILPLVSIAIAGLVFLACNKQDILPTVSNPVIFSAVNKMSHAKDTLSSSGDTIWLTATGSIADTSGKYAISANLKTADSVNRSITTLWIRNVKPTFDTVNMAKTGLFRWMTTMALPIPAIPTKNKLTTTAVFSYGLPLSSQMGNLNSSDNKITYVK